jgi:nucleotidyltransferase substrate binding protein (TIGR01987 family)
VVPSLHRLRRITPTSLYRPRGRSSPFFRIASALPAGAGGAPPPQSTALLAFAHDGRGHPLARELAWNLLKDYLQHQGLEGIIGSRDATRLAFQNGLIADGEGWMAMIRARNQSSRTVDGLSASLPIASIAHPSLLAHIARVERELYRRPDAAH